MQVGGGATPHMKQHRVCMRICRKKRGADCSNSCAQIAAVYAEKERKVAELQHYAAMEAAAAMHRFNMSYTAKHALCGRPSVLGASAGETVNATRDRKWRYYTLLSCGKHLCLIYKENVAESKTWSMVSDNGLTFTPPVQLFLGTHLARNERLMAHNLAVLRVPAAATDGQYVIVGGMGPATLRTSPDRGIEGIRLSRGPTWPWRNASWSPPDVVITGSSPTGCLDRRPSRVPFEPLSASAALTSPSRPACEFDGRLSLVHFKGRFLLYARANLWENALSGGRWVQTTVSADDGLSWAPWELTHVTGLHAGRADVYFFAVQPNPVDPGTLLAIFPLSQPPHACVALAFSCDGFRWSTPRSLRRSRLGWRTRDVDGFGPLEWRAADHPVASGVVAAWTNGDDDKWLHIYLHHGVSGVSMAHHGRAHVARYRLPWASLRKLTRLATSELRPAGSCQPRIRAHPSS